MESLLVVKYLEKLLVIMAEANLPAVAKKEAVRKEEVKKEVVRKENHPLLKPLKPRNP